MLGWFKKRKAYGNTSSVRTALPVSSHSSVEKITKEEAEFLFEICFKGNAHASVFYANCAGLKVGTLTQQNSATYVSLLLNAEPELFSKENIKEAVDYRLKECIDSLTSDIWELSLGLISTEAYAQRKFSEFGLLGNSPSQPSERLSSKVNPVHKTVRSLREKVLRINSVVSCRDYFEDFDLDQVMLSICLKRRNDDYDRLIGAIVSKIDNLRSIFSRLRNSSTNKYGDYDPAPMLDELSDFIEYTFTEAEFDFYYSIKPLSQLLSYINIEIDRSTPADIPLAGC